MDNNYLGHTINHLRKEKGWTQDQLAEKLGISFQAVSKWENSTSFPDITILPELADIFGIRIDEFFRESPKESKQEPPIETLNVYEVSEDKAQFIEPSPHHVHQSELKQDLPWEDDGKLRAVLYEGHSLIKNTQPHELKLVVEVNGDIKDLISDFSVNCNDVYGNARAGDGMNCNDVYGNANAGDQLNCNDIKGNARAGDSIRCSDIAGDATAGDDIKCSDIGGIAVAGGAIRR